MCGVVVMLKMESRGHSRVKCGVGGQRGGTRCETRFRVYLATQANE